MSNNKGKITGIVPGIILIAIIGIVILFINSTTNNSSENYNILKEYIASNEIKSALSIITNCGFKNYSIERESSLDTLDGEETLGFRVKGTGYNAVLYIKDNKINSIRFADKDLYRDGKYIDKISNYIE